MIRTEAEESVEILGQEETQERTREILPCIDNRRIVGGGVPLKKEKRTTTTMAGNT